jgi:DNA polymerase/3'-5' exonuclease PolX
LGLTGVSQKFRGLVRFKDNNKVEHFWIDVFLIDSKHAIPMRTYLIGSGLFNIEMRIAARSKGYKLNQYGLYDKKGKLIPIKTEDELFKKIGMKYAKPSERSH